MSESAKTILVVDDMAIFRDPIAASLRLSGYETLCASDGAEAIAVLRAKRPDLMLLDIAMPKLSGLGVLKAMRLDPLLRNVPVIALTASTDKRHIVEAAKLGAREYMLKSHFRLADLLERINKHLNPDAAAPQRQQAGEASGDTADNAGGTSDAGRDGDGGDALPAAGPEAPHAPSAAGPNGAATAAAVTAAAAEIPQLMTREECVSRAEGAFQAKTLSGVVAQVITLATSPRGDMAQLASLIGRDPVLSARVLQAANSAAYASSRGMVTTIPDAIRNIGCTTVRNIAAALGIFDVMPETGADGFNPIRCWQHSFATAQVCERLMGTRDESAAGVAYVVGLCHDLADVLIWSQFGREYKQILDVEAKTGMRRAEVERAMLGMTHAELTTTVLRCLGLPETIREPVEALHGGRIDHSRNAVARVLWLADMYANGALLASSPDSVVAPVTRETCKAITGDAGLARLDDAMLRGEVYSLTAMLARLSREDEATLLSPLFAQNRSARVRLVRDPKLSALDPIAAALDAMATLELASRLPQAGETNDFDALVITTCARSAAGLPAADIGSLSDACKERGIPVLWLACSADGNTGGTAAAPRTAPVSLSDLANFVSSARTAGVRRDGGGAAVRRVA